MTYSKCWTEETVKQYFTSESREKQREPFLKTHVPIDKVKVEFSKDLPPSKEFVSQEEFLQLLTKSQPHDSNRIFLLVGETGSGKSELCQWLDYNISSQVHVPIHISRSDTKLQDIIRIINEHLPGEAEKEQPYNELIGVNSIDLANFLVSGTIVSLPKLRNKSDQRTLRAILEEPFFRQKLAREINTYQQSLVTTGKERQFQVLTKESFEKFPKTSDLADPTEVYYFINRTITATLKDYLKVSNISENFKRVSERYAKLGKRPVLLLEDLTSFSFLAEDLIDYLFDLPSGHFDAVIGWTTGFERLHRDYIFKSPDSLTYIKERVEARFVMTDEDGSTFFLQGGYLEMASRYLKAVKCGTCETCRGDKTGLYPFNTASLTRIYNSLQEDNISKKTPRLMLEFVMRSVLMGEDLPWLNLSQNKYLKPSPSLLDAQYRNDRNLDDLVKWYGEEEGDAVVVRGEIMNQFALSFPTLQKEDKTLVLPLSSMAKRLQTVKPTLVPGEDTKLEDIMTDFQGWLSEGRKFLNRESLRKEVSRLALMSGDPCEIRNPFSSARRPTLAYRRGAEQPPIFVLDSGDDLSESEFKLHVTKDDPEVLELLMDNVLGGNSIRTDHVFRIIDWAEGASTGYNDRLRDYLARVLGMSIETFALSAKFLALNLAEGFERPIVQVLKLPVKGEVPADWPFNNREEVASARKMSECRDAIDGLFSSFFMITRSIYDYEKLFETSRTLDLRKAVQTLSEIETSKVRDGFKLETQSGVFGFRDLVEAVKQYASTLRMTQFVTSYKVLATALLSYMGLIPLNDELEELKNQCGSIKQACGHLGIPLTAELSTSIDNIINNTLDWNDLQKRLTALSKRGVDCENVFQYLHLFHESSQIKESPAYLALQHLKGITNDITSEVQKRTVKESPQEPENFAEFRELHKRLLQMVDSNADN